VLVVDLQQAEAVAVIAYDIAAGVVIRLAGLLRCHGGQQGLIQLMEPRRGGDLPSKLNARLPMRIRLSLRTTCGASQGRGGQSQKDRGS
jgi:hypothetical protein